MKLLENGLDSFGKSIDLIKQLLEISDENQYEYLLKDIIITLHHSTETLFKYLISLKDEYLIYTELDKIFKNEVDNKFKAIGKKMQRQTIQFIDAVNRVILLYNIDIKEEEYNRIKFLNDIRNGLTHFEWDFKDEIAEHTVALILPTLFNIYSKNIGEFNEYAEENKFYENTNSVIRDTDIWNLNEVIKLNNKVQLARNIIKKLEENAKEKGNRMKHKEENVDYIECPICKNKKFKANGNLIISNDNIDFIGKCQYCDIEIDNGNAQFVNLNFKGYDEYLTMKRPYIVKLIKKILSSVDLSKDNTELINVLKSDINVVREIVSHIIQTKIDYLDEFIARNYFEKNIYYKNDVCEYIVENKNSFIELDSENIYEIYKNKEEFKEAFKDIHNILTKYDKLTDDKEQLLELIKQYKYSLSYHSGMYLDYDGNDRDVEITIQINFDYSVFEKYLK